MRTLSRLLLVGSLLLQCSLPASAQAPENTPAVPVTQDPMTAVISSPDDIQVGRTLILDASASHVTGERTEYKWSIDETKQIISRNVEAIYTPEKPGKLTFRLTIRSTDLKGNSTQAEALREIVVFQRKIIVIADGSVALEKLNAHITTGMDTGVFVKLVKPAESIPIVGSEDAIFTLLSEQKQVLTNAEAIVVWTDGIAGLQALMRFVHADPDREIAMQNQSIVLITDHSLATLARTARSAYSLLKPQQIIITRKEAINPLVASPTMTEFQGTLEQRDIDSLSLSASTLRLRPWDILSILVNYLLSHGVSGQTVILLLMLPVIATIFAFLKQVVGITTFGLYTPSIVALSFLALGWWIGLLFLIFIIVTGYATRSLMKRWRLLTIPKVAIILTVVSFTLLVLVAIGTSFGLGFSRDTVFILLILSTLAENFINLKTEEGWWSAMFGISETVLGSLLCVFIVQWQFLQSIVLAYPELILLTIFVNIFLGRWTGLRLIEYMRFREVFRHMQEEE